VIELEKRYNITTRLFWVIVFVMAQIFVFGFILPYLISANSWIAVMIGFGIGIVDVVYLPQSIRKVLTTGYKK